MNLKDARDPVSAVLAASIFHFGEISITQGKKFLKEKGSPVKNLGKAMGGQSYD